MSLLNNWKKSVAELQYRLGDGAPGISQCRMCDHGHSLDACSAAEPNVTSYEDCSYEDLPMQLVR